MQKTAKILGTLYTQVIINKYEKIKIEIENSVRFLINVKNSIKFFVSFGYEIKNSIRINKCNFIILK